MYNFLPIKSPGNTLRYVRAVQRAIWRDVFIVFSLDVKIANKEVIAQIKEEIKRLS